MNEQINRAIKSIELSKKAIAEAEQVLAEILQGEVPSVIEPEPASEPVDVVGEVMAVTETTPPRTDLECYLCGSKVYDNRPNKRSGQYKPKAPDFTCSNNNDCSGMVQGDTRMLRKSWWLDSKDLPQEWIKTVVPPISAEDTVDVTGSDEEIHPFDI